MAGAFLVLLVLCLALCPLLSSSTPPHSLSKGLSLSVEKPDQDALISTNGVFRAGFYQVGDNAYCFSIWFSEAYDGSCTVVWMANRDQPVNGRGSKLSLLRSGDLVLTDAGGPALWSAGTASNSPAQLQLHDTGNLVLHASNGKTLWQSFECPTNTLLPHQLLTKNTQLVSSRSQSNYSSGFYKLFFDNDNVIRLLFDGLETSSVYWPSPWLVPWEAGRTTYNNSRTALLDPLGHFNSSDNLEFWAADWGKKVQRRLAIDSDGNLRLYSLDNVTRDWIITWQAISNPCSIHGICGPNGLCSYVPNTGRRCYCTPGYRMKNHTDWSYGCEPEFNLSCSGSDESGFFHLPSVEFYGYDFGYSPNTTLERCRDKCLESCNCKGFQYKFRPDDGVYLCYPKTLLLNGYRSVSFQDPMYIRVPKADLSLYNNQPIGEFSLNCSPQARTQLDRSYQKKKENGRVKFMIWFAIGVGGAEIVCIVLVLSLLYRTHGGTRAAMPGYLQVATGFQKFSYAELKKASRNFSIEIGRGGDGGVYKGTLSDRRIAAIKRLRDANQGEAEFLAEVGTIGRLNHMNLIEIWGYCAEGKHRLLVYEYMEHGSLADNLASNTLDWDKRFEIAIGTAKGLAYLHEECLEWVLHCDVKPQNILLDSDYKPKVADFGLSKLLNRGLDDPGFSRIRGTRGYMAPEWLFNQPITSKVDVYSYGMVMLEMVTGRCLAGGRPTDESSCGLEQGRLVEWVREKKDGPTLWIEEVVDPNLNRQYDTVKMELLVRVALQCTDQDRDARPTMSKVVEMLVGPESADL